MGIEACQLFQESSKSLTKKDRLKSTNELRRYLSTKNNGKHMKVTEIAAWWGAIIATLVFVWDVYKWNRSGPLINVSASPNMETFGDISDSLDDEIYIVVEVTNTGDRKTTITHLVIYYYKSMLRRFLKKTDKNFIVPNPALSHHMPYVLEPGERWLGGIKQSQRHEEMSRNGYLYFGVYHSSGKKPALQRVVINKTD